MPAYEYNSYSDSKGQGLRAKENSIMISDNIRIVVEAPASIANLGPGFDILAMAIHGFRDLIELTIKPGSGKISIRVEGIKVPEGKENTAYGVIKEAIKRYHLHDIDFHVKIIKGIPPALGLGSSGATAAATAYAISAAIGLSLSAKELVKLAGAGEAIVAGTPHYDNVSASILGGIVLIDPVNISIYKIKPKTTFWIAILSPNTPRSPRKTFVARKLLPKKVDLSLLTKQLASVSKIIHALHVGDLETLGEAISSDYIVEPARAKLIPKYWDLKKIALENGALGFNIAGAGPSVFSIYRTEDEARETGNLMLNYLKESGIDAKLYITKVSEHGVRIVGDDYSERV